MESFRQEFKKKSDSIRLRAVERHDLKERLLVYMEYHPLTHGSSVRKKSADTAFTMPVEFSPSLIFKSFYARGVAGAFALLLVAGLPAMAERALPGDILYPMKVQFNEELRAGLSLNTYAKVEWETTRLERRIAEARLLAKEGRLTEDAEQTVTAAVKKHSDSVRQNIASLENSDREGAALAAIDFSSTLAVQSEMLEEQISKNVTENSGTSNNSMIALVNTVRDARADAETTSNVVRPSFERLFAHIESSTTRAEEFLTSVRQTASEKEIADIERRLADIGRKVELATAIHTSAQTAPTSSALTAEADDMQVMSLSAEVVSKTSEITPDAEVQKKESVDLLRQALIDTNKLIAFMTDIDVRSSVSVERLIPITPTDEERREKLTSDNQTLLDAQTRLEQAIVVEDDYEKFEAGKNELQRNVTELRTALDSGDYKTSEMAVEAGLRIIAEIEPLIIEYRPESPTEEEVSTTSEEVNGTTTIEIGL